MTYIVQRDSYRCGPVAIINALRWAGKDVAYKAHIQRISQLCECNPPKGTKYRPFVRTLRKEGKKWFTVELITEPTLQIIEQALRHGKAMAWNFKHERGRHYAFITGMEVTGKAFYVANYLRDGPTVCAVSRNEMKHDVKQEDRLQRLWVLTKLA